MIVTLDMARELETQVKLTIIKLYGKLLPSDKKEFLENTEFVDEKTIKGSPKAIINNIIRKIMSNIVDVTCLKDLEIDDETMSVTYGKFLNHGLVEFYSNKVAHELKINLDEKEKFKENLEVVNKLYEELGDRLDTLVFNFDTIRILEESEDESLNALFDEKAIEEFKKKNKKIKKNKVDNEDLKEDLEKNETERIQIVYIDGKQHIKYVDKKGKVHLVETNESKHVSEVYKRAIMKLKPGEKIDAEELFKELTSYISEIDLNVKEDIKTDSLNSEEVNMLNFVHSKDDFKEDIKEDVVTHSSDQHIHVLENSNDIVVTDENDEGLVKSTVINDDNEEIELEKPDTNYIEGANEVQEEKTVNEIVSDNINPNEEQEEKHDEEKILTPEEYEKLCMKFANNENLTLEELRALKRSTPEEMKRAEEMDAEIVDAVDDKLEDEGIIKDEKGPVLVPSSKRRFNNAAFTNKYLLIYVVIITICIGFIVGALLFKKFGV